MSVSGLESDRLPLLASCFSGCSLIWHLLRKSILLTFSTRRLRWSSFDPAIVTLREQGTTVTLAHNHHARADASPSLRGLAAAQGSFSHFDGCHSWTITVDTQPETSQSAVRVGICDAAGFDPRSGRGQRAWGIDPFSRRLYGSEDAFRAGRVLDEQPLCMSDAEEHTVAPMHTITVRMFIDMDQRKLYFQVDNGAPTDSQVEIPDNLRGVSAWCLFGSQHIAINAYSDDTKRVQRSGTSFPRRLRAELQGNQSNSQPEADLQAVVMEVADETSSCQSASTLSCVVSEPSLHESWTVPSSNIVWGREIGHGGFGVVFEVTCSGTVMAAKQVVHSGSDARAKAVKYLGREFRALEALNHENIVKVYGIVVDNPQWCAHFALEVIQPHNSIRSVVQVLLADGAVPAWERASCAGHQA